MTDFKLWLEFENTYSENWDPENDAANIHVDLPNGKHYGINVWTFKFLETLRKQDEHHGANLKGLYQTPPDLFVKELTRDCIEKTIQDLIRIGNLEEVLNPSVLEKK
ncbi:MAG: hypothetical protein A3G95_09160 [Flavobacteria bacterium RIFCSPLOWO2_12_FULL_31_7]|nr:MAG: hypothetical protein A3G95_09160 [Flavobacteria bacterium RIFCSPLOWO2_12_FULL_31_7]